MITEVSIFEYNKWSLSKYFRVQEMIGLSLHYWSLEYVFKNTINDHRIIYLGKQ